MAKDSFLVDTSVIIDSLRGFEPATRFLNRLAVTTISVVTCAELFEGCRNKRELNKIRQVVASQQVLLLTPQISIRALNLLENYYLRQGILFDDALIAATAIEYDLTLATTERKHFRSIGELRTYYPY